MIEGRILLMDDEEIIRNVTSAVLIYLGYEVATATNGDEAISLYIQAKESGYPYDAVVLDLKIPRGMDGKEAIQKLIELDSEVRAIVLSGYYDEPVIANYRKYGFKDAIVKPYQIK